MDLLTERLKLRELSYDDLLLVHALNSLPETDVYNTLGLPESISVTKEILDRFVQSQKVVPRESYVMAIEDKHSHEFIGLTGLSLDRPKYRKAEIWYKIHPSQWGKGFATEVVKSFLDFGFKVLKLHRIEAGCAVGNIASKRVLEKSGMLQEGYCRELLPIRGQWVDGLSFAILEKDYQLIQTHQK